MELDTSPSTPKTYEKSISTPLTAESTPEQPLNRDGAMLVSEGVRKLFKDPEKKPKAFCPHDFPNEIFRNMQPNIGCEMKPFMNTEYTCCEIDTKGSNDFVWFVYFIYKMALQSGISHDSDDALIVYVKRIYDYCSTAYPEFALANSWSTEPWPAVQHQQEVLRNAIAVLEGVNWYNVALSKTLKTFFNMDVSLGPNNEEVEIEQSLLIMLRKFVLECQNKNYFVIQSNRIGDILSGIQLRNWSRYIEVINSSEHDHMDDDLGDALDLFYLNTLLYTRHTSVDPVDMQYNAEYMTADVNNDNMQKIRSMFKLLCETEASNVTIILHDSNIKFDSLTQYYAETYESMTSRGEIVTYTLHVTSLTDAKISYSTSDFSLDLLVKHNTVIITSKIMVEAEM